MKKNNILTRYISLVYKLWHVSGLIWHWKESHAKLIWEKVIHNLTYRSCLTTI